ncbi:hypothetical protein CAEBREN_30351 [Caenorhabditis brenneri]|uniref:Uncharacterized protein n=1 Tax=Caenorhabditis brenneri TaxID=135651 RepID=G0NCD5_CAEBE|nr:hypothetical protein CAEBREN_30351 [Caenorhabditis brenneri]
MDADFVTAKRLAEIDGRDKRSTETDAANLLVAKHLKLKEEKMKSDELARKAANIKIGKHLNVAEASAQEQERKRKEDLAMLEKSKALKIALAEAKKKELIDTAFIAKTSVEVAFAALKERQAVERRRKEEARKAEEEAKKKAKEAEEARKAAEEARIRAEDEQKRRRAEEEARKKQEEAEEARKAEEEARKKQRQAEDARKAAEEVVRKAKAEEDARKAKAEEDTRKAKEAEDARKAKAAEDARKAKAAEDARQATEEAARKAKAAEDARQAKAAEDARKAKEAEDKAAEEAREASVEQQREKERLEEQQRRLDKHKEIKQAKIDRHHQIPQTYIDYRKDIQQQAVARGQKVIQSHATAKQQERVWESVRDEYREIAGLVYEKPSDKNDYASVKQQLEKIRPKLLIQELRDANQYLRFSERDGRIHLEFVHPDILFVEFEPPCAYFLGFHDTIVRESGVAPSKVDMFGNVSTIYLYCDIIDPIIVGDQKNQLLSVIPCRGTYGEMIHHTIPYPRYLPIMNNTVDSIKVEFLSEFAEPINFNWGSTIIVLHFKRIE